MRKCFGLAIVLASFCLAASAQAPQACKTATERVVFPKKFVAITDYDVAPLEFLFSDHGVDFYSATSYRRPHPLEWIRENGATAIIVYQDEAARQKQIDSLREGSGSSPFQFAGFPQHWDNTKYAMVNFYGPGASFVRDVEYFQPTPCVTASDVKLAKLSGWMDYSDLLIWDTPGLHAFKHGPNWVTGVYSSALIVEAKGNPMYIKIHNMMADKVKEYTAKSTNHGGKN